MSAGAAKKCYVGAQPLPARVDTETKAGTRPHGESCRIFQCTERAAATNFTATSTRQVTSWCLVQRRVRRKQQDLPADLGGWQDGRAAGVLDVPRVPRINVLLLRQTPAVWWGQGHVLRMLKMRALFWRGGATGTALVFQPTHGQGPKHATADSRAEPCRACVCAAEMKKPTTGCSATELQLSAANCDSRACVCQA
jgi:hypothetical protein